MIQILQGDCLEKLREIGDGTVQCCVTSPPYWGLRDYGVAGQIGLEKTPEEYVAKMVEVFREVKRVLRDDGTLWLNLGDSYCSFRDGKATPDTTRNGDTGTLVPKGMARNRMASTFAGTGIKHKDLVGIPWRVAFALQADGWYLRSDIIWHKPNPMPESVTDRPTKAHEYIFLMSKQDRYYYDAEAVKEPPSPDLIKQIEEGYNGNATKYYAEGLAQDPSATKSRIIDGYRKRIIKQRGHSRRHAGFNDRWNGLSLEEQAMCGRNKRTVWTIATSPYKEAHFATFPEDLIKPCILAGSKVGDTVIDPFGGSGTTGQVALELGRKAILIELNPKYIELINQRTFVTPGLPLA